jgi:hypothetical protein
MKIDFSKLLAKRVFTCLLTISLTLGLNIAGPAAAVTKPDVEMWHQYSQVDPIETSGSVAAVWDLKLAALKMESFVGRVGVRIITHQESPADFQQDSKYFVVNFDLNNDNQADLSVSTQGGGGGNQAWGERVRQTVLNPKFGNKCKFYFLDSHWLDNTFSPSKDAAAEYKDKRFPHLYFEHWQWDNSAQRRVPCGIQLGKRFGLQVQTLSDGQVVDQIPNNQSFVKFSGKYNDGWVCGPATNGLIRENVPSNVSKRFLPASFTPYSYCAFSNDSWRWQGTKPGPRGSAPSKSKSSTPKP